MRLGRKKRRNKMRNLHRLEDGILYTTVYSGETPIIFKTSECDVDTIKSHYWHYIRNATIATLVVENSREVPATVESIIFNSFRKLVLYKRNLDNFDFTRANMSFIQSATKVNTILYEKNYAILCMENAQVAFIDLEDVDKLRPYYFRVCDYKSQNVILSQYITENGGKSRLNLSRLILGMKLTDSRRVSYKDGDIFNCRKSNLKIKTEHPRSYYKRVIKDHTIVKFLETHQSEKQYA